MTTEQLYSQLKLVTGYKVSRETHGKWILENPELIHQLIPIIAKNDDPISCKAAWILEYACKLHLEVIFPYLNDFFNILSKLELDPSIRPAAKMCELLMLEFYSKSPGRLKTFINEQHKILITEACFDWLITEQKVAPKAHSMTCLYLLGLEIDWIHPELLEIIERDFTKESAAFQARSKHILRKIQKQKT